MSAICIPLFKFFGKLYCCFIYLKIYIYIYLSNIHLFITYTLNMISHELQNSVQGFLYLNIFTFHFEMSECPLKYRHIHDKSSPKCINYLIKCYEISTN